MDAFLPGRSVFQKLTAFFGRLTEGYTPASSSPTMEALQEEIHQIEQTLAKVSSRSTNGGHPTPLEPLTEQQKIIDLAG